MESKKSCKGAQGCAGHASQGLGGPLNSVNPVSPEGPEGQPDALGHSPRAEKEARWRIFSSELVYQIATSPTIREYLEVYMRVYSQKAYLW